MSRDQSKPDYRLDEIDRRIIYELMTDARTSSAPKIAKAIDVSPGTIRNRIAKLEDNSVITGYHAQIDFERTSGRLTALFMCSVPFADRQLIVHSASEIPGVINIRLLMGGRRNVHVLAIGEDTADLRRIGTSLSELGVEIDEEMLVEHDAHQAYAPFGPTKSTQRKLPGDFINLAGESEIVELTVRAGAPISELTISEAVEQDVLNSDLLIIAIERDENIIMPHGNTQIQPDDVVTVFSQGGVIEQTIAAFLETSDQK